MAYITHKQPIINVKNIDKITKLSPVKIEDDNGNKFTCKECDNELFYQITSQGQAKLFICSKLLCESIYLTPIRNIKL